MLLCVHASVLAVPFTWGNACESFSVIEPCKHEALLVSSPQHLESPGRGANESRKVQGPFLKCPHVYAGSLSGHLQILPSRICFSEVARRGRLKKKKAAPTPTETPAAAWTTKGLTFEQRAGWDLGVNADTSSLQLWTGGPSASAKVPCPHSFGQEMQFNPPGDWWLCKMNGVVPNPRLRPGSTKSESNVSPPLSLLSKQGQLVPHFKSSKLVSRKLVPRGPFAGGNSVFWGEIQRWLLEGPWAFLGFSSVPTSSFKIKTNVKGLIVPERVNGQPCWVTLGDW